MMAKPLTWELPIQLSPVGIAKMAGDAVDEALLNHRKRFLPMHFTREAKSRYPKEYEFATPGPNPKNKLATLAAQSREAVSAYLKAAGPAGRAAYFSEAAARKRAALAAAVTAGRGHISTGTRERTRDRRNEIPLFDTGAMKSLVLGGTAVLAGSATKRTLRISVPLTYANVSRKTWKGGALNKTKAVQAVTPEEVDGFASIANAALQTAFNAIP